MNLQNKSTDFIHRSQKYEIKKRIEKKIIIDQLKYFLEKSKSNN